VHENGKMERDQRGEHDSVLTFGQGGTMATEGLTGVGEESPALGKNSLELGKTT
jgi:hypothetical protein